MKTCRTCVHWTAVFEEFSECGLVSIDDEYHPHNNRKELGLRVTAPDDQGLQAALRTGPDFGCILYEEDK